MLWLYIVTQSQACYSMCYGEIKLCKFEWITGMCPLDNIFFKKSYKMKIQYNIFQYQSRYLSNYIYNIYKYICICHNI